MLTLLALLVGATTGPRSRSRHRLGRSSPGSAWNATLVVKGAPRSRPIVLARPLSGRSLVFGTRRLGHGKYRVRIVLRRVGRWADAVLRVDGTGAVARRVTPTRQFHADGVAAANGELWLFDAVTGVLVRLPA